MCALRGSAFSTLFSRRGFLLRALPRGRLEREICSRSVRTLRVGLAPKSETGVMHLNGSFSLGIATWVFWGASSGPHAMLDQRRPVASVTVTRHICKGAESFKVVLCLGRHLVVCEGLVLEFVYAAFLSPVKTCTFSTPEAKSTVMEGLRLRTRLSAMGRGASALRGKSSITSTSFSDVACAAGCPLLYALRTTSCES